MVRISIHGVEATIQDYQWTSEDPALSEMLNGVLSPDGPTGSDPDPDYTAAQYVVDVLSGEIIDADEIAEDDDEVIY